MKEIKKETLGKDFLKMKQLIDFSHFRGLKHFSRVFLITKS